MAGGLRALPARRGAVVPAGRRKPRKPASAHRRSGAAAALLMLGTCVFSQGAAADTTLMAGAGVYRFTDGFGWQLATSVPGLRDARVHYTRWEDNWAVAIAYDLRLGPLNVSPGVGRMSHANEDIERRGVLHLEVGWQLTERLRCQVTHFSSPADDQGENLLLCGVRFR